MSSAQPAQAIERVRALAAESGTGVSYTDGTFTFTFDDARPRRIAWTVDEPEFERLAAMRRREARTALGAGDGWTLLLIHLQEQLETFTGDHGIIDVTTDGRLVITASGTDQVR